MRWRPVAQQQLADASGTSLRTIQRIEAGATPGLETLKSLAAVFETTIVWDGDWERREVERRLGRVL